MIYLLLALSLSLPQTPVITLERTVCYGRCPAYTVSIFADGKVVYEGREFVKHKGKFESQIPKAKVNELVREFERIDYFKLDDNYSGDDKCPENWTDNPSAITSFRANGETKAILHYLGCRGLPILAKLIALENKIDEVANTKRWIE